MCTSIVVNKKKTIVGWNLDITGMEWRVSTCPNGAYIEILTPDGQWLPMFGANSRGDFVGMPTCWPYDKRSDGGETGSDVIMLDIELLLQKRTLAETRVMAQEGGVFSGPGITYMAALSDKDGNVLHIVPGQGVLWYEKPEYKVLTNFSPFKGYAEEHPWMGRDRFEKAEAMLKEAPWDFDAADCFEVLKAVSQTVCPTVVSMVFDVDERSVYWCENRQWDDVKNAVLGRA